MCIWFEKLSRGMWRGYGLSWYLFFRLLRLPKNWVVKNKTKKKNSCVNNSLLWYIERKRWCSARKIGGFNRWKNLSCVLIMVIWTTDTCRAEGNRAECVANITIISRIVWRIIMPALWLNSLPFSFIVLKYKENSTYFSGSKGGKRSIIKLHKKNKSAAM